MEDSKRPQYPDPTPPVATVECIRAITRLRDLFIQGQYRQCIEASLVLSDKTIEGTHGHIVLASIEFYCAIANDSLARAMHDRSPLKAHAFGRSEHHYLKALELLASQSQTEDCRTLERGTASCDLTSGNSGGTYLPERRDPLKASIGSLGSENKEKKEMKLQRRCRRSNARGSQAEGLDLVNNATVNMHSRGLIRDFSSISLLQPSSSVQLGGLMRPVRMGSPPRPYFRTFSEQQPAQEARAPGTVLLTRETLRAPPKEPNAGAGSNSLEPIGRKDLSPLTRVRCRNHKSLTPVPAVDSEVLLTGNDGPKVSDNPVEIHLTAMRDQIRVLVSLVREARSKVLAGQTMLSGRKDWPNKPMTENCNIAGGDHLRGLGEPSIFRGQTCPSDEASFSQSYGSTLPEASDSELQTRANRIRRGREIKWNRPRFDPSRYQKLAENALAEL